MVKVGVIVGSLRQGSLSGRVAKSLVSLLPEEYEAEYLDISQLPLYNPDLDQDTPKEYNDFREAANSVDAMIFVTPEYNRTMPAALKNALDVISVPTNKVGGKPALVASQSPGLISGFGANHHVRQVLSFLDMPTVQQPEVYISRTDQLFGEEGEFLQEGTEEFLQSAVDALRKMIEARKE